MQACYELLRPTEPLSGISLHHGSAAQARILPRHDRQPAYALRRTDLPAAEPLLAELIYAAGAARRTTLGEGPAAVETAEHVLSALAGCRVVGAAVELDGPELPILDGSAQPWVQLLEPQLGVASREAARWKVVRDFEYRLEASVCRLTPSESALIECSIDFSHPLIGRQRRHWDIGDRESYIAEIAPARTFGFLKDAERLWAAGLAKGASLDSVLVFDDRGLASGELRFADEPVRHKLLDAIGDLALLGAPLAAGVVRLERPSHQLVIEALKAACADGALAHE